MKKNYNISQFNNYLNLIILIVYFLNQCINLILFRHFNYLFNYAPSFVLMNHVASLEKL